MQEFSITFSSRFLGKDRLYNGRYHVWCDSQRGLPILTYCLFPYVYHDSHYRRYCKKSNMVLPAKYIIIFRHYVWGSHYSPPVLDCKITRSVHIWRVAQFYTNNRRPSSIFNMYTYRNPAVWLDVAAQLQFLFKTGSAKSAGIQCIQGILASSLLLIWR